MAIVVPQITKDLKYIPKSQIGVENPFSVYVRVVPAKDLMILEDKVVRREGEEISFSMGRFSFDICKAGVIGWENITDDIGKELVFSKSADGIPLDTTIASMGIEIIQEVANVISAISRDKSKIQVFFPEE